MASMEPYAYLEDPSAVPVELASDVKNEWSHVLELPPEQEDRAMKLHRESIVIDLHEHPHRLAANMLRDFETYARSGRIAWGFEGLKLSGMTACVNGYGGSAGRRSSPNSWQFEDIIWDLGMRQADLMKHPDVTIAATCVADIYRAKETGRCAVFADVENAGVIGNEIDRLDVLYGLGVRVLGLSYNQRNTIADGSSEDYDAGLSKFGRKVVKRMNQLGILMDFAHSGDQAILDTLELSDAPCCVSHSIPKALRNHPKAKSDDLLKKMAEADWVFAIQSVPNVTSDKPYQSIFDIADQIDHCVEVMGVDHVAIGTDAFFGSHLDLHRCISRMMGHPSVAWNGDHVDYLENPAEMPNVTRVLVQRGYSDEDIKKIIGMNVVRLFEKTIG